MAERHFAFFREGTGEYVREWKGPVPDPSLDPFLVGDARELALIAWATAVSDPQPGEIGLDVTHFDYPLGDFCWMVFRQPERLLDWPHEHTFIQIDLATMTIDVNNKSPRPVRSTRGRAVIDITGTPLERFYGQIFGRLVPRADGWGLEPLRPTKGLAVPMSTRRALEAALIDLDLATSNSRVLAHV